MTDKNPNNPAELQKPAGAQPPADEPVIHTIPDKFYGAALKKKIILDKPKPPAPPQLPPAGPPGLPGQQPPKKKKKTGLIIGIVVAVLLLGGGAAAYFLVFAKKPVPTNQNQNVNVAPPAPVCGNSKCEKPQETSLNCEEDCGPPPPVCGDAKCEKPQETSLNCSADCGPPPPVCGDKKCEETETVEACPADCKPPEPQSGNDSDSDGLTDAEETQIYGTSNSDPNTDKDSFVDLNEVLNLFDPAKPAPSNLSESPGIRLYVNEDNAFSILFPSAWKAKEEATQKEVFFNAPTGEFIEVLVQEKPAEQGLMDWYLAQSPGVRSSDVEVFKTKQGYDEIQGPDRTTAFVAVGARVFVISYNLGSQLTINYKVTHQMMVNSLMVKQ